MATAYLLVGLPAAGKTTVARRLAAEHRALRLTPDEWMIPLFGESDAGGRRDVLEGRLISLALQALRIDTNVVLDLGCWARDERSALRRLVEDIGATYELVYLPIEPAEQLRRIARRWAELPTETFPITADDLANWRAMFEVPEEAELSGSSRPEPPESWTSWAGWAANRWPSLMLP